MTTCTGADSFLNMCILRFILSYLSSAGTITYGAISAARRSDRRVLWCSAGIPTNT
ncbi:hypothetical protein BD311DRAFT_770857 [Dichomitus squalens]|uniref:Uncharacterized protein n=1 Tax=Dichomitus squalens TaxID=114155 RepID=A0A4Q9M7Q8_9APHY|nr:hypothetical protein BD311DRAFT_770857 [Dichomitus squalens]